MGTPLRDSDDLKKNDSSNTAPGSSNSIQDASKSEAGGSNVKQDSSNTGQGSQNDIDDASKSTVGSSNVIQDSSNTGQSSKHSTDYASTTSQGSSNDIVNSSNTINSANNNLHHPTNREKMTKSWDKFVLLMWKNCILRYRSPFQTLLDLLLPMVIAFAFVAGRHFVEIKHHDTKIFQPFSESSLLSGMSTKLNEVSQMPILYTPSTNTTNDIMQIFTVTKRRITPCEDLEELLLTYKENENEIYAAIQFPDNFNINDKNIHVSIRFPSELRFKDVDSKQVDTWSTNLKYENAQTSGPRSYKQGTGAPPEYYKEGFLSVQILLTLSILAKQKNMDLKGITDVKTLLKNIAGDKQVPELQMQRYPHPEWNEDAFETLWAEFLGMATLLSFYYGFVNTVKGITVEKETQLKEAMKIMGLSNWIHWTAWFLQVFIILAIASILMVVVLKVQIIGSNQTFFNYGNAVVIVVFLLTYICAIITLAFLVSVFCARGNMGVMVAGIVWILIYTPYMIMKNQYGNRTGKMASCILPNTAIAFGFHIVLKYEGTREGVQWGNLFQPVTPDDDLTLGLIMIILLVAAVIFLIITLYVEAILPGEYGVILPWYFPFTSSFWCGRPRYTGTEHFQPVEQTNDDNFEKDPDTLNAGVQIKHLRKVYKKQVAVSNLSLNMYENQITVLLGHNGAGKTTTMSILTGMCPPTSGTAIISGYDIITEMPGVRKSLGFCPQHNILFDNLTVKEHLYFYSKLKGLNNRETKSEIYKYIKMLNLEKKRNVKSSKLSGGMKRKLCVGIAFCANSKVVMLDEPSAGMDPSAKRELWSLIETQKEGRTIILTTHYMDEADVLADRVAIMVMGEIRCCGSTFFLKKKFGAGYHLVFEIAPTCDVNNVTKFLQKHIPGTQVESKIGSELIYSLDKKYVSAFESMLKDLEANYVKLGIYSFGISLTTLEEVFLKVGTDHGQDKDKIDELTKRIGREEQRRQVILKGNKLLCNQTYAMFMKRILSSKRSWLFLLIQIFLPGIALLYVMFTATSSGSEIELPSLPLNLAHFPSSNTLFKENNNKNEYVVAYRGILSRESRVTNSKDLTEDVLKLRKKPIEFRYNYIVGGEIIDMKDSLKIIAYFNNDALHSPGISYAFALNAIYQVMSNCPTCFITFYNYPLPYNTATKLQLLGSSNSTGFQVAFILGIAMTFSTGIFILFIIRERASQSKHLQLVSGVKVFIFWLVTFICDYTVFLLMTIVIIIIMQCFRISGYATTSDIGRFIALLLVFGVAVIPLIYVFGYLTKTVANGFSLILSVGLFIGPIGIMAINMVRAQSESVADSIHWGLLVVPYYSFLSGVIELYNLGQKNEICKSLAGAGNSSTNPLYNQYCSDTGDIYLRWASPGIGRNLIILAAVALIFLIIILLLDFHVFHILLSFIMSPKKPKDPPDEDDDVVKEKEKIRNLSESNLTQEYIFVMKNVSKTYDEGFVAVNGICVGAKPPECFGLLGVNGAGKTSIFKMMTGDVTMTYGNAWVKRKSVKTQMKKVRRHIGYCPQFDALLDNLTARETLIIYALLRGVPREDIPGVVKRMAIDFDFTKHLRKQVKQLSGGNKRKLSTAIAFMGNPLVVYLDEPTAGMDPGTRRFVWNAICKFRDSGKLIILTSHNMEECEALCTRIAIMVNGNFKCLGSIQHLKTKFAKGFTLTIKVKKTDEIGPEEATSRVESFITRTFPSATLKEKHLQYLVYYINDNSTTWSKLFGVLERAKNTRDLYIEDYSVGQSSLEQVFLTFIKDQR